MKRLILILTLLCSSSAFAACVASTSGAWTTGTNWTGCAGAGGVPASTDAVTIGNFQMTCNGACDFLTLTMTTAGGTLTIQNGGTLTNHCTAAPCVTMTNTTFESQSGSTVNFGSNTATSQTHDVVLNSGITFLEDNGSLIKTTGTIFWNPTNTTATKVALNGHTLCTPNGTAINQGFTYTISGGAVNSEEFDMIGPSWSAPAVFESVAGQVAGGGCRVTQLGGVTPKTVVNFAIFNNCGDTTNSCFAWTAPGNGAATNNDFSASNILMNSSGSFQVETNSGLINGALFSLSAIDIRNPNAHSHQGILLQSLNTNAPSTVRQVNNVTCDDEGNASDTFPSVQGSYFTFGQSSLIPSLDGVDTPGMYSYGCAFQSTGLNNTEKNLWAVIQYTGSPNVIVWNMNEATGNVLQNSGIYLHANNPHVYNNTTTGGAGSNDILQYVVTDGDHYEPGDSGELCHSGGTWSCIHNISINGNQNIENTQNPQAVTLDNNTIYDNNSMSLGETSGANTEIFEAYDNIVDHPGFSRSATDFPNCSGYESFAATQSAFAAQTAFNADFNMWYGIANTADNGARTCGTNGSSSVLPFRNEYGSFNFNTSGTCGPTTFCSVRANSTGASLFNLTSTTISSSPTVITYAAGGFTTGVGENLVAVGDPVFNNTRNKMAFIASITSDTAITLDRTVSTWASGDKFTIGKQFWADNSIPGTATNRGLHDMHTSPQFVNPGAGFCSWYSANVSALTCPTVTTATTGSFANNATIGHAIITINGWDQGTGASLAGTNCTANCPQRVTPFTHNLTEVLKYIGNAYRVMNGMAKNSGHATHDLGASWQPNYPPAILSAQ